LGIFEILMVVGVGIVLAVVLALVWAAISRKAAGEVEFAVQDGRRLAFW